MTKLWSTLCEANFAGHYYYYYHYDTIPDRHINIHVEH